MASTQTTPYGYGSRIALRLCGTTAMDGCSSSHNTLIIRYCRFSEAKLSIDRHCERSEAIHGTSAKRMDRALVSQLRPSGRHFAPRRCRAVVYSPSTIFATISRWISEEPPKIV